MRPPPNLKAVQLKSEGEPLHKATPRYSSLIEKMNKPPFYSLLAVLLALILGLATLHSKANLDMQWGEHQRLRISPGEVPPNE